MLVSWDRVNSSLMTTEVENVGFEDSLIRSISRDFQGLSRSHSPAQPSLKHRSRLITVATLRIYIMRTSRLYRSSETTIKKRKRLECVKNSHIKDCSSYTEINWFLHERIFYIIIKLVHSTVDESISIINSFMDCFSRVDLQDGTKYSWRENCSMTAKLPGAFSMYINIDRPIECQLGD